MSDEMQSSKCRWVSGKNKGENIEFFIKFHKEESERGIKVL